VIGGTANTVLAFDLDEKQGAAEGSAFLRVIEFDFAIFSGGTYGTEPFEVSWGASVLKNPVFTLQPTDHFGWKPFYTAPTFETVSPEHFYGWIGFEMATFFDSV
jgi:hypothetical protein